jgi:ABC-2 type transport system permease protein
MNAVSLSPANTMSLQPAAAPMPTAAPMKVSRLLRAYLTEARFEVWRTLRTPAFLFPTIALPVMLYVFFGVVLAGAKTAANPAAALGILSGFAMFSVIGPGLFGIGTGFAIERQSGVITLKRALPMPPAANLVGKLLASMTLALLVMIALVSIAVTFGHVSLTLAQIAKLLVVGALGVVPFCALGLLVGSFASGSGAPAAVNLIYFPMVYLSGLFPFGMPKGLQSAQPVWPAFHVNQLSRFALDLPTTFDLRLSALVLTVFTVVCVTIAARRLSRVG